MLVHSTDTGFIEDTEELEEDIDFVELWRSGKNKENHIISTAYINQDFLGNPPVGDNGIRYGFTHIEQDAIRLMGVTDINTYSTEFAYDAAQRQYLSAKTMPYHSRRVYSEFGIERQGTSPSYVIIFDDDTLAVKNNGYRAAAQFNIPVILIDKQEIEQQQIQNLKSLITQFEQDGDMEILKTLINHYETNRAGWLLNREGSQEDRSHTSTIDHLRFMQDFDEIAKQIEELVKEHLIEIKEKDNAAQTQELISMMEILLGEIELYKDSETTKPISKTHISFDAQGLVKEVNHHMTEIGASQYAVDIEDLPSIEEYRLTIKQIITNALTGENAVTIEDVDKAQREMQTLKERGEVQNDR